MEIKIRQEEENDFQAVFNLIENAFEKEEYSDHKEQFLVERLRKSAAYIPELALVAEQDGRIVGYLLLTKIKIKDENGKEAESLALAPVAVLQDFQGKGIGGQLIRYAHEKARKLGFGSIVLLGHEQYYPRFGYELTSKYGIRLPFDVPSENCMVIELVTGALQDVQGVVEYPKAFFE
ncbi:GNAT family N-acetyltransferase [Flavobacterium cerinum]|uniref:N-acetyltransferase n=1 Tax=Flavobacterium cerinum TaxID=2502784 RepID=A0ABY5ISD4_9FLAO|nr:N-acetyltransferase [Flavobacterium cerinum]UUC45699.1 N-acetyltransferase [Flavobacterium cerinum]